jgi:hypothetical protein
VPQGYETKKQDRKEVNTMDKTYEAPQLKLIGQANEVVMGSGLGENDLAFEAAPDFEFEQD